MQEICISKEIRLKKVPKLTQIIIRLTDCTESTRWNLKRARVQLWIWDLKLCEFDLSDNKTENVPDMKEEFPSNFSNDCFKSLNNFLQNLNGNVGGETYTCCLKVDNCTWEIVDLFGALNRKKDVDISSQKRWILP